ncbi:MAG: hypothetical protein K0S76_467 [Herbinix sp.]|jgi:uncharacterized protein YvpB|nr:hypothetical protein [Herbinix sp.]
MRRNYYNVYKDGKLIKANVNCYEVSDITGISKEKISKIASREAIVNGFRITLGGKNELRVRRVQTPDNKTLVVVDSELIMQWNEVMAAAELIRKGGKIVCKNGKRYVEESK